MLRYVHRLVTMIEYFLPGNSILFGSYQQTPHLLHLLLYLSILWFFRIPQRFASLYLCLQFAIARKAE